MIKIEAKKDFILNGTQYICGDEIKIEDISLIKKMNEKGLIKSLSYKDLVILERDIKIKKGGKVNGTII